MLHRRTLAFSLSVVLFASCSPGVDLAVPERAPIIGGTRDTGHPSVVAVYAMMPGASGGALCSGSVIGPHAVMTAKHCVFDETTGVMFPAADFTVVLADDISHASSFALVSEVRTTPGSDIATDIMNGDDIAILLTSTRLSLSALTTATTAPSVGTDVTIVGYGRTRSGTPDPMDSDLAQVLAIWNPLYFEKPDGSTYAFHQYYLCYAGTGFRHERMQGGFEFADGRRDPLRALEPVLTFDPINRRFKQGEFRLTMGNGRVRTLRARAIGATGFHLGAGLYHGFDGKHHGSYRGRLALEGEHFADCSTPEAVARLNQFRDCLIVVEDAETGATGWGNCQTYVTGAWPDFGLPTAR